MNDITALLILLACALIPSALVYWSRRDIGDPRVIFPLCYVYLTTGPVFWSISSGYYYHGIEIDKIPAVLLSASSAVAAFHLGSTLCLARSREVARAPGTPLVTRRDSTGFHVLRGLLIALLGGYAIAGIELRSAAAGPDFKASVVGVEGTTQRVYYLLAGFLIAAAIALVCYAAFRSRKVADTSCFLFIGAFAVLGFTNGERDAALPLAAWILVEARFQRWKRAGAMFALLLLAVAAIPVARRAGLSASAQAESTANITVEEMVESFATSSSANLFVFTKIATWVPTYYGYSLGHTYLDGLASAFPWNEEARSRSLLNWFRDEYAPRGLSGYGFALDAEAYMNFGWVGPPVFFLAWGAMLGALHRAGRAASNPRTLFYSIYPLIASLFAIRADSRVFSRLLLYGVIVIGLVELMSLLLRPPVRHL